MYIFFARYGKLSVHPHPTTVAMQEACFFARM